MPSDFAPYQNLLGRARDLAKVEAGTALLNWDEETYLPRAAIGYRAEQVGQRLGPGAAGMGSEVAPVAAVGVPSNAPIGV